MGPGTPPDPVNNALIARAQGGDQAAFSALFERYRRSVFRYLYYRVGDQHTADDLTAEVFLRVMQALPSYRRQGTPFQAWVFQIARNLAVDHFRKVNTRHHFPLNEELAAKDDDLDHAADQTLTGDRLRQALAQLTDEQREVITLRFVAEMPIAEVAAALSKSESAVKALQRRGLEALRDTLTELKVAYD
jgi:RNA polymerase sigma-70 factor (ECF subfamily)